MVSNVNQQQQPPSLHSGQEGGEFGTAQNTKLAAERVRRKVNQRVVDLIDIYAVGR